MDIIPSFDYALTEVFQQMFEARLQEGGVRINNLFETLVFSGSSTFIKQDDAPDEAVRADTVGDVFDPTNIAFWRRRITPQPWKYSVTLNDFDMARTGGFDIGMLAHRAADGCSKSLDRIVIEAMTADVYCDNNKKIPFNPKQYIPFDFNPEGIDANNAKKLISYKIMKAVEMMNTNGVKGTIIAISDFAHLTEFMQDERVASTDFNIQPAMATGITNPYGGINGFVPSLMLPHNVKSKKDNSTMVDHIYVVATDYIKIGTNMPWQLKVGENPQQNYDQQLIMKGMYDAVRKEEAAVVIIEAAHLESSLIV